MTGYCYYCYWYFNEGGGVTNASDSSRRGRCAPGPYGVELPAMGGKGSDLKLELD